MMKEFIKNCLDLDNENRPSADLMLTMFSIVQKRLQRRFFYEVQLSETAPEEKGGSVRVKEGQTVAIQMKQLSEFSENFPVANVTSL